MGRRAKTIDRFPLNRGRFIPWEKKWSWLHTDTLLAMHTSVRTRQKSAYLNVVSRGEPREIEKFYSRKNLAQDAAEVIAAVCDYYRISQGEG